MPSEYAAFLREPLHVTVAGTTVTLPYRPAAVWAKGLEHLGRLVAVLADEPARERIVDLAFDSPQAVENDLTAESLRILGEQGGRAWWEVARLVATSAAPEVLGRLVLAGVDPHARSLGEWVAATYALCVKGQDEKGRLRFDFSLSLPPPGYEDEWDDGMDPAAAEAAVASMKRK